MTITRGEWAGGFLLACNFPPTDNNTKSIVVWIASEDSNARFNPLDTELNYEGSTAYNSAGVQDYTSYENGMAATKATLFNGYYAAIIEAFNRDAAPAETCQLISDSPWGSKPSSELVAQVLGNYDHYASLPIAGSANDAPPFTPSPPIESEPPVTTLPNVPPDDEPVTDATGGKLNAPIVAGFQSGDGYVLVGADGGAFALGGAVFHGSIDSASVKLAEPIVDAWGVDNGNGYIMVAADGGVFAFGDGKFQGSL